MWHSKMDCKLYSKIRMFENITPTAFSGKIWIIAPEALVPQLQEKAKDKTRVRKNTDGMLAWMLVPHRYKELLPEEFHKAFDNGL